MKRRRDQYEKLWVKFELHVHVHVQVQVIEFDNFLAFLLVDHCQAQ